MRHPTFKLPTSRSAMYNKCSAVNSSFILKKNWTFYQTKNNSNGYKTTQADHSIRINIPYSQRGTNYSFATNDLLSLSFYLVKNGAVRRKTVRFLPGEKEAIL